MSYPFDKNKTELISNIVALIREKVSKSDPEMVSNFVQKFYGTVSYDDLMQHTTPDLFGAAISLWNFIYERKAKEIKIRAYNPDYETNAWQTNHTIIEINTDDMPFLVDTTLMEINRLGITSHLIMHTGGIHILRNDKQQIIKVFAQDDKTAKTAPEEAVIYVEIDRQTQPAVLSDIVSNLQRVLSDVRLAVDDWQAMRQKVSESIVSFEKNTPAENNKTPEDKDESIDFLKWIIDNHFTFLGCRDFDLAEEHGEGILKAVANSELGVLRKQSAGSNDKRLTDMTPEAQQLTLSPKTRLIISKSNTIATVHRPNYTESLVIKRYNDKGQVIGIRMIVGLFTSAAYNTNPKQIPFLRTKVASVIEMSRLSSRSHAGKVLLNILETLPRDDLFQASNLELLEMAMGIFYLQERRRIRMFARRDIYGRFISCLVYVPKERFNTELRQAMQTILENEFHAKESTFSTRFSESVLARIHFTLRIDAGSAAAAYDMKAIEQKIITVGRAWEDDLAEALRENFGEEHGNQLVARYHNVFPSNYRETVAARTALYDIKRIESLSESKKIALNFYQSVDELDGELRFKLYNYEDAIPLSDALPILENMGMRVISEQPFSLRLQDGPRIWINDFGMKPIRETAVEIESVKENFQESFARVWAGEAENDGLNQLVIMAGLNWRQITILRAYAKYFRQTGFTFSQSYIEQALIKNTSITKALVDIFELSFDPINASQNVDKVAELTEKMLIELDQVASLDEDKILRRYLVLIQSTLRTNYFQKTADDHFKPTFAIKLDSKNIPDLPLPKPMFEIFVYSPSVEGVHLRGAKVARGGIRWSDRREDFRTEVLGLMKAQQVKNAVIVPLGAKGGFFPKRTPIDASREEVMAEGIRCYKLFIGSLLDLTDNIVSGAVVPPKDLFRRDEDDPYLVVAADKGTATFSDIANSISAEHQFWLGDAFASGGSAGYDHKKMGITARGGWESVKRHFRELGINIQDTDFTCIGIGDMAGDVFGNGMLLSRHTKLVAAFNHMHIFLDPNPNPENSFKERERLFNLPRSTWADYDSALISAGGGVFKRSEKSIAISEQMRAILGITDEQLPPNDLIRAILKAPVDLLWNGGIGTYVKSSKELNTNVGDRSNDAVRINGAELRARVVGEGGNLGFTQLGRIEYASNGGLLYTDFIDNSGGVDCSDHEVNIKILLNDIVQAGDLTSKQRDVLLAEMTDEVAGLVLKHNFRQTQAISLAATQALTNSELHSRYMDELEKQGSLNRALEFLPDQQQITENKSVGQGLTRPELAVLLAYAKTTLKEQILKSDVPEDPYLGAVLRQAFPKPLRERYAQQMYHHSLHREIIANQLANNMVNLMGLTFVFRLFDETGASADAIVKAYTIASMVFNLEQLWSDIESLDNKVPAQKQFAMMMQLIRLIRRSTRWLLKNRRLSLNIEDTINEFTPGLQKLVAQLESSLEGDELAIYKQRVQEYNGLGLNQTSSQYLASSSTLLTAFDIIEAANQNELPVADVAKVYYAIDKKLDLGWIRSQIVAHVVETHWDGLTREALRDDLDSQQRLLTISILKHVDKNGDMKKQINSWMKQYQIMVDRWRKMLVNLRGAPVLNFTMYFVAIRELLDLTQTSMQTSKEKTPVKRASAVVKEAVARTNKRAAS